MPNKRPAPAARLSTSYRMRDALIVHPTFVLLLMMVKPRSQMRGRTANALFSIPLSSRRSDNLASSKTRESATTDRNPILAEVNLNSAS